jgi:signal transduction histidine kinase
MKISVKIFFLLGLLLSILALDGLVSVQVHRRISKELKTVVDNDMVFMQTATAITRLQLQKAVIVERVRGIAEEMAFQQTSVARREHLVFHTRLAKTNFDALVREGALKIVAAKKLVDEGRKGFRDADLRRQLADVSVVLKEIERAHIHHDALMGRIFQAVLDGDYDISQENLGQMHRDEKKLSTELQRLIDAVQRFTQDSLERASAYERAALWVLWGTFILSLLAGLWFAASIIRSVTAPLKELMNASLKIGAGDLDTRLSEDSGDEFGALSRAFNRMSLQLRESKDNLDEQQAMLRQNLDVTAQQKKELEVVNRELDRFVHTVSHDIRSPLMSISWYADLLKRSYFDRIDQRGQDCIEGISRGVERSNTLIKDLLVLTRISRVRNPYGYVLIQAVLEEVAAGLDYRIRQNNVDLVIGPHMPGVICDGIKVKEAFFNLISNAIKFSSGDPAKPPRVQVDHIDRPEEHEFVVRDNGIGIDPRHHEEIFIIFRRLDTSDRYEGTGTGLSIVKSVVDDHGGRIWVESALGQGTAIHFTIPKGLEAGQAGRAL